MITDKNDIVIGLQHETKMRTRYQAGERQWLHKVNLDFTGTTISDLLSWATAERVIKFQNHIRNLDNISAFNAFMELGDQINIFALDANKPLDQHTDRDELLTELMEI